jgi:hypothetical protein
MENDEPIDMEFDDEDAFVDYLIEMCILQEEGFDEDGEVTYTYNFEIMKEVMPELYEEIMSGVNDNLMSLYELGLVKIEYDENLNAHFSATPEGMEFFNKKYHSDGE